MIDSFLEGLGQFFLIIFFLILGIWLFFRLFGKLIMRLLLRRFSKRMNRKFQGFSTSGSFNNTSSSAQYAKDSDVKNVEKTNNKEGEYIEYEEID